MRRTAIVALLLVGACSPVEFETLLVWSEGDDEKYRCDNDETYSLPAFNITNPTPGGQARFCLGIALERCPSDAGLSIVAGDPQCDDPNFNRLRGTCVDDFFSCFRPTGGCSTTSGGAQWDSGHFTRQDDFTPGISGALFPPTGDACMAYQIVTDSDLAPGTSTEIQYLKPL